MSSLANGCAHCGSLEHSTNKCPHFLSTKCIHCGSLEHSSNDCPHGLLSTKCIHCGSVNHASSDCPHGMLSTKCIHCGSLEHSSNNCPHGLQSKCIHCGSVDHSSNQCPNAFSMRSRRTESYSASPESGDDAFMGCAVKFIVIIGLILLVFWFVFSVAIPLILINTAILTLIAAFIKPNWNKLLLWVAIVTGALVVVDYNAGWLSGALIENISMSLAALRVFMYINLIAGLIAAYFVIRNYLDEKYPKDEGKEEISNRNLLVIGGLVLIGGLTYFGQSYLDRNTIQGEYPVEHFSGNQNEERIIQTNPSQPIDNLFKAWQNLDFELYKSQWNYNAVQYSQKFRSRNYGEIMNLRESLFNRLNNVEVVQYQILETEKLSDFKTSIKAMYSMVFHFKNGRTVTENNITERYVVEFDQSRNLWLISQNYDYID